MANKQRRIGVILDPIEKLNPIKDTSLALMLAAQEKGWAVEYLKAEELYLNQDQAMGISTPVTLSLEESPFYTLGEPKSVLLGDCDAILMRKDPPFNTDYIYSTYILERAQQQGALVVNDPQSLRDCNEKLFATQFPQCCPPLIVSANPKLLKEFHQTHQDVIFKPLDGMGGSSIFRCKADDPNVSVILETLTQHGSQQIMAQAFIPDITKGDKRVLIIDGEAVPFCLARIPTKGETRGNLAAGGRGEVQPLSERDQWIVNQVSPTLLEKGLLFVGLDIIGDYLTEINVTSPTCAREIDRAQDTQIGERLISAIEKRLGTRTK